MCTCLPLFKQLHKQFDPTLATGLAPPTRNYQSMRTMHTRGCRLRNQGLAGHGVKRWEALGDQLPPSPRREVVWLKLVRKPEPSQTPKRPRASASVPRAHIRIRG